MRGRGRFSTALHFLRHTLSGWHHSQRGGIGGINVSTRTGGVVSICHRLGDPDPSTFRRPGPGDRRAHRASIPRRLMSAQEGRQEASAEDGHGGGHVGCWYARVRQPHPSPSLRLYERLLWQRIYREVFPDFARMDKLTRQYQTAALRRNVKGYQRRHGRKWSAVDRVIQPRR
jgi:hypothetical protein